jgi:hypothetical protein
VKTEDTTPIARLKAKPLIDPVPSWRGSSRDEVVIFESMIARSVVEPADGGALPS